jgi:hypothetical protein
VNKKYKKLISERDSILHLTENQPWYIIKYEYRLLYLHMQIMAIELERGIL